jgi:hypothetical protein
VCIDVCTEAQTSNHGVVEDPAQDNLQQGTGKLVEHAADPGRHPAAILAVAAAAAKHPLPPQRLNKERPSLKPPVLLLELPTKLMLKPRPSGAGSGSRLIDVPVWCGHPSAKSVAAAGVDRVGLTTHVAIARLASQVLAARSSKLPTYVTSNGAFCRRIRKQT